MKNKYKKIWPWFVIPILFFVAGVIFTKTYRQAQIALSAEINERKKADTAVPTWLTTNKEIIQIKQTI